MVNHREATITSVHGRIANVLKYVPDRANGGGRPKGKRWAGRESHLNLIFIDTIFFTKYIFHQKCYSYFIRTFPIMVLSVEILFKSKVVFRPYVPNKSPGCRWSNYFEGRSQSKSNVGSTLKQRCFPSRSKKQRWNNVVYRLGQKNNVDSTLFSVVVRKTT